MSSNKIVIFSAISVATLFLSQIAQAGLFDDLRNYSRTWSIASGNMPEIPSGSGSTGVLGSGALGMGSTASSRCQC